MRCFERGFSTKAYKRTQQLRVLWVWWFTIARLKLKVSVIEGNSTNTWTGTFLSFLLKHWDSPHLRETLNYYFPFWHSTVWKTLYSLNFAVDNCFEISSFGRVRLNQTTIIHFVVDIVVILQTQHDTVLLYGLSWFSHGQTDLLFEHH